MDADVQRELDTIKRMILKWKQRYIETRRPQENVALDFKEDLKVFVYPYILRLTICSYINHTEFKEFITWCKDQTEAVHVESS